MRFNDHNNFWPRNKTALFQDDTTGEAIYVSVQRYPKYYYPKDSAAFWEDETNEKKIIEDFVIQSKKESFGLTIQYLDLNTFLRTPIRHGFHNWIFIKDNQVLSRHNPE